MQFFRSASLSRFRTAAALIAMLLASSSAFALATTTTTVVPTPGASTYGQNVSFVATVTGIVGSPRNSVSLKEGATVLDSQNVNGQMHATMSLSTLSVGTHTLIAVYAGNAGSNPSSSASFPFVVSKATSTTTMTAPGAIAYGAQATFTATVTGPGATAPTGSVTFSEGGNPLCSGALALVGGIPTVTCNASGLGGGSHSIVATYGGDGNYDGGIGATRTQVVNQATTSTALNATPNPSISTHSVTFTATMTSGVAGAIGGTADFYDGATKLNALPIAVVAGQAAYSTSALNVATHSITAQFLGDTNYAGSTSSAVPQVVNLAATTTALNATPNPTTPGISVTFTASVSSLSAGTIGGTVDFYDGATKLNPSPVAVVAGQAAYSTSALTVASHSITAQYSGDAAYAASTSDAVSEVVALAVTTTTLNATPNPTTPGISVTFTANVSSLVAGTIGGTVDFYDGITKLNASPVAVVAGQAAYSTSTLSVASHSITAQYSGDGVYATSTSDAVSEVVALAVTTTTLNATPNPTTPGISVTFTASVSSLVAGAIGGTVDFYDGITKLNASPVAVVAGQAAYSTSAFTVASHSITAQYSGDAVFATSTSDAVNEVVALAVTTTTLNATPNPTTPGISVTFTTTVSSLVAGTIGGTVDFYDGATKLNASAVAVVAGQAAYSTSDLTVASHSITAQYSGDGVYATSTSDAVSEVVALAVTTTTLNATPNPSTYSVSVTFTATVSSLVAGTIGGTVDFYDGATKLNASPVAVVAGQAAYSTSALSIASHSITAQYSGDAVFATSTSSAVTQIVNLAPTTTALVAAPNPSLPGVSVTLTATVTSTAAGTIGGSVDFYDGATKLNASPVALASGQASYSTSLLSIASHSLTANYLGDATYATSSSNTVTQVVDLATTTTAVSASPNPASTGASVTITATVTSGVAGAIGGTADFYDGATKLNASAVAVAGGQAAYSTSSLTAGSHSITAQYLGDSTYAASLSPSTSLSVRNITTTTLGRTPNPAKLGNNIVFTATVTPSGATGTVDLIEGVTTIASGAVTAGVATINVSILGVGSHSITAHYNGDAANAPSNSSVVIESVTGRPRSDLDGDGKSDIVLQNQITSSIAAWIMNANAIQEGKVVANPIPAWRIVATGDFDGDGKADILLQNNSTGAISNWKMNGALLASGTVITTTSLNWRIVATRDFNGDGKADIVLQNMATGAVNLWQMNGSTIVANTQLGTSAPTGRAVGVGHLGGDAIVFQDTATGAISRWIVNGTTVTSDVVIGTPSSIDIKVTAVADFNSDGDDDLALQNSTTRTVSSWILSPTGASVLSSGNVATPVAGWLVVGAGDYDADGYGDMLLYNSITNVIAMWQMNGTTIARGWNVGTLPGWKPLGN
ncbi:MAG: Flagellar hook-length control protein FliK [Acidobacteria bacterium]|nr:Flagellar hook-length control protein FliK [Acidobacteriota bacterium]